MAAPANKTIKDFSGKWIINKTISDPRDPPLALQGIGWVTRKAICTANITQHTRMYYKVPDNNPSAGEVLHIDIDQTASGFKGTSEKRVFDWTFRPHSDWIFGDVVGRSRFTTIDALLKEAKEKGGTQEEDAKFLSEGWLEESANGDVIETYVDNDAKGWTALQVWGFSDVNGERWFTRRVVVRRKDRDEAVRTRVVHEWVGELDA